MRFPLLAQQLQRAQRQRDVAILVALAAADMQEHALGVDVTHLETQTLAQPQTAGVEGDQADPVIERRHGGQDAAHLAGREDHRQLELRVGAGQLHFHGPGAAERFFPEDLEGADGLGAGLAGDLFVLLEVDAVLAELLRRDQVGGFVVVLAELAEAGAVGLFGAGTDGQELQVIGEGFKDGVGGTFFICIGLLLWF